MMIKTGQERVESTGTGAGRTILKQFTVDQLAPFDGTHGRPAYVAYCGKVYDVTRAFRWEGGRHQLLHEAGKDLTAELSGVSHGEDLFARVPLIGLVVSATSKEL